MSVRRALAAALVLATIAVGSSAAPAVAATSDITMLVAPEDGGMVRKGRDLAVDVTVTNSSGAALPAGSLGFSIDDAPYASSSALLSRFEERITAPLGFLTTITAKVPPLDVGESSTVRAVIPDTDSALGRLIRAGDGARLLYVKYRDPSGIPHTVGKAIVSYVATSSTHRIGFGTVVPITVPAASTGLVDTDAQAMLTMPGGAWDAALRAARRSPGATVALDPAVLASIRLARSAAPPSATDFLAGLQSLPNQVVRLPYADGDVTLQRAAGVTGAMGPTSFSGSSVIAVPSDGSTATPQPTPTAGTPTSTSVADLTAWNWSEQQVAWPVPRTTGAADVATFGRAKQAVLLASTDVQDTAARRAAGPLATVRGTRVQALVADATLSSLLATATGRGVQADAALAELIGFLATAAVTGETSALLAVAGRSADPNGLARVLGMLDRERWVEGRSLADLATQQPAVSVGLARNGIPGSRVSTARSLIAGEAAVQVLGKAVTQGATTVTGPPRLALLGLLSASWRGNDRAWATAAATARKSFTVLSDQVSIVFSDEESGAGTNVIGTDGKLQVTVLNRLSQPVKVLLRASVSNDRLQFTGDSSIEVSVPAAASSIGRLSFRSITNGSTDVTLTLATPDGRGIGEPVVRPVTVRAGFDTVVAIILLSALGALLALGVYRNVRRRRRPRVVAA